jgi:hypothetical protein
MGPGLIEKKVYKAAYAKTLQNKRGDVRIK